MPQERENAGKAQRAMEEFEEENQKRLGKKKQKEFLKQVKEFNDDGMMQGDLLDGITSIGANANRAFKKKDKKWIVVTTYYTI